MSVTVRVALRVRPFSEKEKKDDNLISFIKDESTNQTQQQQIKIMDGERRHFFTFDHVYPPDVSQVSVYASCIQPLFEQFTKGYNATILAYGQTGSGKTYSMGTSGNISQEQDHGIVPRFTENLFQWILSNNIKDMKYQVKVSFLELYHEDIIDLLNVSSSSQINIREDVNGNITWSGVHEKIVESAGDLLNCLQQGSLVRTTASTEMNSNSSRSHAIFSVTLIQQLPESIIQSKFHFVDLAGSERLKKTHAIGDRAKEGISINSGLLALGNVISALGDEKKKTSHVPYRNSKLTRLLQDSLGGNSQTLMLACVSPADSNANETLSTLKYANRAKNITNRVILNQQLSEVDTMKQEIIRLRQELKSNDAFIKEVHVELEELRKKNLAISKSTDSNHHSINGKIVTRSKQQQQIKKKKNSKDEQQQQDEDDVATLVGSNSVSEDIKTHRSTSTKKRKKHNNNSSTKTSHQQQFSLEQHKNRLKKELLFIKQMKSNDNLSGDPISLIKMINLFQSSVRDQKQLIQHVEHMNKLSQDNSSSSTTTTTIEKKLSLIPNSKKNVNSKPSLMRQPNTVTPSKMEETMHRTTLVVEENKTVPQLKQIMSHVKKSLSILTANEKDSIMLVQQLKPILSKIVAICNIKSSKLITSTTTTKSSSETIVKRKSTTTNNGSNTTTKRSNIAESHREIQRIITFDNIKSNSICTEICKSLKEKKLKLLREQKDLIKERKAMLKEFYQEDDYAEEQQKQQYMDERIDVITVEIDFITEQLKRLHPTITVTTKIEKSLIDVLKPLKEQDLRSLLFMVIQQDLIKFNVTEQLYNLTVHTLERFQSSIIQMRRDNGNSQVMNSQVLKDLLKSTPIKCLSNGLILPSAVKA